MAPSPPIIQPVPVQPAAAAARAGTSAAEPAAERRETGAQAAAARVVRARPRVPVQSVPVAPRKAGGDWERIVGGKWALWVGSVAVFLAVSFFLAYTWHYLGAGGRLAVGFLAALAFLAAGELFRPRAERWFSAGLSGAGLGLLYLSIWAGTQRYCLFSFNVGFALMFLSTAFGVVLALRHDAVSLTALATLGGFLTPVLLRSGGEGASQTLSFLTYIGALNAGILGVSLFKRWRAIVWLSFSATVLLMLGWADQSYVTELRWVCFAFVSIYFLLFVGAACFYSLIRKERTAEEDLGLLFLTSSVYVGAGFALLYGALGNTPGAFPLAIAAFFALLSWVTRTVAPENQTLRQAGIGLCVLFVTLTIPIQLRLGWIAIGWSVEAAVLVTLGLRLRAELLHRAGQIVWLMSVIFLAGILMFLEPGEHTVFINERALPLLIGVLATGWMGYLSHRHKDEVKDTLASAYAIAAVAGGAWLIAQETYLGFDGLSRIWPLTWQANALFAISCLWAVYAVGGFLAGLLLRHPVVRWTCIVVATLAPVLTIWAVHVLSATEGLPFWNARFPTFLVDTLMLGSLVWTLRRSRDLLDPSEVDVAAALSVIGAVVLLWGATVEVYLAFGVWLGASAADWRQGALLVVAALWAVYALAVLLLGVRWRQLAMRGLAYAIGAACVGMLVVVSWPTSAQPWLPIVNWRFGSFVVVTAVLTGAAAILRRNKELLSPAEREPASWIGPMAALALLWGMTLETYESFRYFEQALGPGWDRAAQMAISLVWTLFGVVLLIGGVIRRYRPVRLLALVLIGITALKVFLLDLSFIDTPYRVLSFGGLGLALIGISWLYSRYGIGRDGAEDAAA
jgi:uncharacterized membrane protein